MNDWLGLILAKLIRSVYREAAAINSCRDIRPDALFGMDNDARFMRVIIQRERPRAEFARPPNQEWPEFFMGLIPPPVIANQIGRRG